MAILLSLIDDFNPIKFIPQALIGTVFTVIQWSIVISILFLVFKYTIWNRIRYKDDVTVYEHTGTGIKKLNDKGRWIKTSKDGTGYYGLLKDKKAKLKAPDQSSAFFNKKGKLSYDFLKLDDTGFGYAQIKMNFTQLDEEISNKLKLMQLSDLDWGKMQIKREQEKRSRSWLNEHTGTIALGSIIVVGLLSILWIIGFANDILSLSLSESSKVSEAMGKYTDAIIKHADALKGVSSNNIDVAPAPEGF